MKTIELNRLMIITFIVLTILAYALPNNIMDYYWINAYVDTIASFIPAIEKLKQGYEQGVIPGLIVFLHSLQLILIIMATLLMIKRKILLSGKKIN